VGKGEKVAH